LRQKYTFISKKALRRVAKYAHARQMKRKKRKTKGLKCYLGRVYRDALRKAKAFFGRGVRNLPLFNLVDAILFQVRINTNKIYSFREPHVCCIAKGKAHKKYEFGCKVSVTVIHKEGLALKISALEGNHYDGHTLKEALMKAEENYKKEWNDGHGCWFSHPLHNFASHGADVFRMIAISLAKVPNKGLSIEDWRNLRQSYVG
jgi:IS5 family transposase